MILCRETKFKKMPLIYLSFVLNFKQHENAKNANFVYFEKPPLADSHDSNKSVREARYTLVEVYEILTVCKKINCCL